MDFVENYSQLSIFFRIFIWK